MTGSFKCLLLLIILLPYSAFSEISCKSYYRRSPDPANKEIPYITKYNLSKIDPLYGLDYEWKEFLTLEREKNVHLTNATIYSEKELETFHLLQFIIPEEYFQNNKYAKFLVTESENMNSNDKLVIYDSAKEKKGISYFVKSSQVSEVLHLIQHFGQPKNEFLGLKLSGRSSNLIWDPEGKVSPFILKLDRYSSEFMSEGVKGTDLIMKHNSPDLKIMQEKASVLVQLHSFHFNRYLIRDVSEITKNFNKGVKTYPLHGFIGSDLIDQLAAKMNLSRQEWIAKEYIPLLAKKLASQNYLTGIYLNNHTQNSLIEINRSSGKISDFIFKDIQDIMVDPFFFSSESNYKDIKSFNNRLYNHFFDSHFLAKTRGKEAGIHFALYDAQSILSLTKDTFTLRIFMGIFLKNYLNEVQKLTGIPLVLSTESTKLINDLADGLEVYAVESSSLSYLQSATAKILNDIHSKFIEWQFQGVSSDHFEYNQITLYYHFNELFKENKAFFVAPAKKLFVKYGIYNDRLIAYDTRNKSILATSIKLLPEELESIKNTSLGKFSSIDQGQVVAIKALKSADEQAKNFVKTLIEADMELQNSLNKAKYKLLKAFGKKQETP